MPAAATCALIPLSGVAPDDAPRVGAKAVGLARLARAGAPVPPAWCVPVAAYRAHFETHGLTTAVVAAVGAGDTSARRDLLEELRGLIVAPPLPETLLEAIGVCLESSGRATWAVRSSATAEDLPTRSFAGQYDSFLDVTDPAACADRVKQCWASLWTERAFEYRRKHAIDHHGVFMAVLIQAQVDADVSGVAFTADPVSGREDAIIIEAGPGLGADLVSGRIAPDRLVLARPELIVTQRTVPSGGPALPDALVPSIARLAVDAETLFGAPVDVEWAVAGADVFVVQARPITAMGTGLGTGPGTGRTWEDRQVWTNANAGEVMPDVVTPLTESAIWPLVERLFDAFGSLVGVDFRKVPIIGIIAGRIYFNLNTLAGFARAIPVVRHRELGDLMGGHHGVDPATTDPTLEDLEIPDEDIPSLRINLARAVLRVPLLVLGLAAYSTKRGHRYVERARGITEARWRSDWPTLSDAALADRIRRDLEEITDGAEAFRCLGVAVIYCSALFGACRRWFGDEGDAIAARLLAGLGGLDSAEAGLALWRLATLAVERDAVGSAVTAAASFDDLRGRLGDVDGGAEFLDRWQAFMWQHGHHARGEIELFNARWSEQPDYVLDLVRSYLREPADDDPVARSVRLAREREEVAATCRRRLRNPFKRLGFRLLVRQAQSGLPVRENLKSDAVRRLALARRMLLELGSRCVRAGILVDRDDVFFLRLEELPGVLSRDSALDVPATVAVRRAEHERHRAVTPPAVVRGRFDPERSALDALDAGAGALRGVTVSPGVVTGPARVILRAGTDHVRPGEILVAPFTDPGWTPYFLNAAGIVMDLGGILSHGSIVAREYGIPCVVNVGPATQMIRTGQRICVDGDRGEVRLLAPETTIAADA